MEEITTIRISKELLTELKKAKLHDRETYEDLLWDLLENTLDINAGVEEEIDQSIKNIESGKEKTYTWEEIEKEIADEQILLQKKLIEVDANAISN